EQLGSEDKIEQAYGMTIGKIRILLKDDLEKKLKSDKLKRKKFPNGIKASDKEVKDFFAQYRDSIPEATTEYEIAHLYLTRTVTDDEKKIAYDKANQILDSIKSGVNFEDLARRNSDDVQSAKQGGDLGFAKRGMFVKEFEEVLFNLKAGEISDIVETEYGYHIIKATDKRADQVRSSHILVMYPKLESNDFQTISKLKDIKADILSGKITFEDAVKKYSQEKETADKGGYLGFVNAEKLDSNVAAELKIMSPGQISDPLRVGDERNYGYELMKVISIKPAHKLSLETDYDKIKKYAEFFKENTEMDKWLKDIRRTIFIDIKM
ncbi:MAG TPA: peptidylprolyl isomerase, partial [Ignavibacteria bacterium]|nr:peptidylprolyl isomerase [Ignavibacteria bacterium]